MDQDDNEQTHKELPDGFQKGMEQGLADPNEERKGRLREAIRRHARANRKVIKVKARRARKCGVSDD